MDAPGCSLGIIKDGQLIYAKGYGMANIEYDIHIEEPYPIQDTPQQDTFNSQRKN